MFTVFPGTFVLGTLGMRVHPAFLAAKVGFVAAGLLVAWNVRCPRCGFPVFRLLPRQPITWQGTGLPAQCPQCDLPSGAPWPGQNG